MSKPKRKTTDAQIRKRLNEIVGVSPPTDNWRRAIQVLREGNLCCVVNRGLEIHVLLIGVKDGFTLEETE